MRSLTDALASIASLSRLSIVCVYASGSLLFSCFLTGSPQIFVACIGAFDWLVVNLTNRMVDVVEDSLNGIPHTSFAIKHKHIFFGVLAPSLALSFLWQPVSSLSCARVLGHCLGALYNFRLLPTPNGYKRLKELYAIKNLASCAGFLITLFLYPLAAYPRDVTANANTLVALIAFFTPLEISFEVLYDLRDLDGDRAAGVSTFPVIHGAQRATSFALVLDVLSLLVLASAVASKVLEFQHMLMGIGVAIHMICIALLYHRDFHASDVVLLNWGYVALQALFISARLLTGVPYCIFPDTAMILITACGLGVAYITLKFVMTHEHTRSTLRDGPVAATKRD